MVPHIARYFLRKVRIPPKCCETPPWHLVSHRYICAILHVATYRVTIARCSMKINMKEFCTRYEKYRCWASKVAAAVKSRGCGDLRPWSLRASCNFEGNPKNASGQRFFWGRRSEKPCDFCSEMVASPLAATVVTAILRCDFCAAVAWPSDKHYPKGVCMKLYWTTAAFWILLILCGLSAVVLVCCRPFLRAFVSGAVPASQTKERPIREPVREKGLFF